MLDYTKLVCKDVILFLQKMIDSDPEAEYPHLKQLLISQREVMDTEVKEQESDPGVPDTEVSPDDMDLAPTAADASSHSDELESVPTLGERKRRRDRLSIMYLLSGRMKLL